MTLWTCITGCALSHLRLVLPLSLREHVTRSRAHLDWMMWTGPSHPGAQFVTGGPSQILQGNDHFTEQTYIFLMLEYAFLQKSKVDAFIKKEVKQSCLTLVQELTKLRIEKQKAEKALCKAQAIQEDLEVTVQQITVAHDAATRCKVCKGCIDRLFVCLRDWFHTHLREQLNAKWRNIPKHLRWHPITAKTLTELYDGRYLQVMLYDCPLCEGPVWMKPIEVNNFSDFLVVVNNVLGQPQDHAIDNPHLLDQDIWGDVFHDKMYY
ncbi:hypothetical protein F5J12DRAFT_786841 [Pisolithus orientalis]|uniref:uncharacterized protein n=1 Tax=Pisolithus orientalis TaxID=936130 RepID=UPI002224AF85|nr:uncharacterized protein F5J12DRAFT_786841 [Pisolithus orientalis]KAI5988479.1 hypothetical protein F5J12DRAFT_786841 [Pisolithus orientalis]